MNFLKYKDANALLSKTGWNVETALNVIEAELKKLGKEAKI